MSLTLYRFPLSGHAHRAELMLSLLGLRAEFIDVDLPGGEHNRPAFLAINAFGQVPVLDDDGTVIADSNAILVYLAQRYGDGRWMPTAPADQAQVQRWLSVAAGQLADSAMKARLVTVFDAPLEPEPLIAKAHALLEVMEAHLAQRLYLATAAPTVADIALYTYIAHAPEGNVSLQPYPNVRAWLGRIEALEGFVAMPATAVGLRG